MKYLEMLQVGAAIEDRGIRRGSGLGSRLFVADYDFGLIRVDKPSDPPSSGVRVDRSERLAIYEATGLKDPRQSLLIDMVSMLPVRWELLNEGKPTGAGAAFTYDSSLIIAPPVGIAPPDCVN